MAGSWPQETERSRGPEGSRKSTRLGPVAPQRGSPRVIAPVCLLLALSMGTMCAQILPLSTGMVSKETAWEFSLWSRGSQWDETSIMLVQRPPLAHRHPQSIKKDSDSVWLAWRACLHLNDPVVSCDDGLSVDLLSICPVTSALCLAQYLKLITQCEKIKLWFVLGKAILCLKCTPGQIHEHFVFSREVIYFYWFKITFRLWSWPSLSSPLLFSAGLPHRRSAAALLSWCRWSWRSPPPRSPSTQRRASWRQCYCETSNKPLPKHRVPPHLSLPPQWR